MHTFKRRRSGFTLVELLVVIGIMGVLAGMLFGGIVVARNSVKRANSAAVVRSLELAIKVFESEWGFYPYDSDTASEGLGVTITTSTLPSYFSGDATKIESNAVLMLQLFTQKKNGPYLEPDEDDLKIQATISDSSVWNTEYASFAPVLLDGWGFPIVYDRNNPEGSFDNTTNNLKSFDIYGYGSNSIDENGGGDDLNNW